VNFILILCDTFRRDHLGLYGARGIRTPCLDRLAAQSVLFDEALAASYPTLPCRAELFTGRFIYAYLPWGPLPRGELLLAELLEQAGYDTALVTDNPQYYRPDHHYDRGFSTRIRVRGQVSDPYVTAPVPVTFPCAPEKIISPARAVQYLRNASLRQEEADYCVAQTMQAAADWLEQHARRGPFFLMVDSFDPHEPWDPPQPYVEQYDPGYEGEKLFYPCYTAARFFPERELEHMRALYAGEVTLVDHWVGRLLDQVDALGLGEDTAVIFLSDHGIYLGEHGLVGKAGKRGQFLRGWPLYREAAAIPTLVRLPGVAPRRSGALVHPGDLMPTILELAGIALPDRVQAISLLPLLRGEVEAVRDVAVSSWSFRHWSRYRPSTISTKEWSLVYWRVGIAPELYHLPTDPAQTHDVHREHPEVARELHEAYVRLLQHLETPAVHYWPRRWLWSGARLHASPSDLYPTSPASAAG
jgi:arylsulfatase A-like enzyme